MTAGHSTPDAALDDRLGFLGKTDMGKPTMFAAPRPRHHAQPLSVSWGMRVMRTASRARSSPPRTACETEVQILPLGLALSRNLDGQRHRLRHPFIEPVEAHLSGASDLSSESSRCIDEQFRVLTPPRF
jgi:hypothetical protein